MRLRLCKLCVCHYFTLTAQVGLLFAAKACFDVREAPAFWGVMQLMAEVKIQHLETASTYIDLKIKAEDKTLEDLDLETAEILAFASTHPADLKRQANLTRLTTSPRPTHMFQTSQPDRSSYWRSLCPSRLRLRPARLQQGSQCQAAAVQGLPEGHQEVFLIR